MRRQFLSAADRLPSPLTLYVMTYHHLATTAKSSLEVFVPLREGI